MLDWRKRQQTKSLVEVTIRDILDKLPSSYSETLYNQECADIYQHVYDSYSGQDASVYD